MYIDDHQTDDIRWMYIDVHQADVVTCHQVDFIRWHPSDDIRCHPTDDIWRHLSDVHRCTSMYLNVHQTDGIGWHPSSVIGWHLTGVIRWHQPEVIGWRLTGVIRWHQPEVIRWRRSGAPSMTIERMTSDDIYLIAHPMAPIGCHPTTLRRAAWRNPVDDARRATDGPPGDVGSVSSDGIRSKSLDGIRQMGHPMPSA